MRRGDAPTLVYFNVLIAGVYKKQIVSLAGRGFFFAVADAVKILAPPAVIAELAEGFPALAWNEVRLKTQAVKNMLFLQPSDQSGWNHYLSSTPRSSCTEMEARCVTHRTL